MSKLQIEIIIAFTCFFLKYHFLSEIRKNQEEFEKIEINIINFLKKNCNREKIEKYILKIFNNSGINDYFIIKLVTELFFILERENF